jgi:hypothetical protein
MHIRNGFVSNSSSSSFIVIGSCGDDIPASWVLEDFVIDYNLGKTRFGWEDEKSDDFGSRVTFSCIQAMELDEKNGDSKYIDMLVDVLTNGLQCSNVINKLTLHDWDSKNHSYIDHQSSAEEGRNIQMFDSEEELFSFLFSSDSYIQTGNDNG